MACKGCFEMYTREETLLAEEIRERQPVNLVLENSGRKEMGRKDNSLQNEQRFKGKKIWDMFTERGKGCKSVLLTYYQGLLIFTS